MTAARRETYLVLAIVIFSAILGRAAFVPASPAGVVTASENYYSYEVGDPGAWFSAWAMGDGQSFALIAIDPTGAKLGSEILEAGYRFVRAGYGWAAWVVSSGRVDRVPVALALVGALAIVGTALIAVRMRPRFGPRAWFLVLNPSLYIGFAGDTAEPLAIFFLAIALAWNAPWAGAALGFTRPDFLVATIGRGRVFGAGVATAAALVIYSAWRFGIAGLFGGSGVIAIPLAGYIDQSSLAGWALVTVALITVGIGARRGDWVWVVSGIWVMCFGTAVTANPANAWRVAGVLPVLWALGQKVVASERERAVQLEPMPADVA